VPGGILALLPARHGRCTPAESSRQDSNRMSNRQARREQSRTARQPRTQRPAPGKRPGPARTGGGGPDWLSRPFLLIVSAVIVAVAAILVVLVMNTSSSTDSKLVKQLKDAEAELPAELANGMKLGKDDAQLKLTVYEDFQCPFCLGYTARDEPALITEYVKTGKMQIIFAHLPILGTESTRAALASECAGQQNKFWQYHSKLFITQAEAGQATNEKTNVGRFADGKLKQFASDLGLDRTKFDACFTSPDTLKVVQDSQRRATQFGISSTPGFLINDVPLGAGAPESIAIWRQVLDGAINTLNGTPAPGSTASPAASPSGSAAPAGTAVPGASPSPSAAATTSPTKAP
jgi:protein-disulfide isomerase